MPISLTPAQRYHRGLLTTLSLVLYHRANMRRIWKGQKALPYPRIFDLPSLVMDPANVVLVWSVFALFVLSGVVLAGVFLPGLR